MTPLVYHRSAALQLLGDLVVQGLDPPGALSTLLDSLRNPPLATTEAFTCNGNLAAMGPAKAASVAAGAETGNPIERISGGDKAPNRRTLTGNVTGRAVGDLAGDGGSDEYKIKRLQDEVLKALPLWARRLMHRSDALTRCRQGIRVEVPESRSAQAVRPLSSSYRPSADEPISHSRTNHASQDTRGRVSNTDSPSATNAPGRIASSSLQSAATHGGGSGINNKPSSDSPSPCIVHEHAADVSAGEFRVSRSPPNTPKCLGLSSNQPSLFGDCLETSAIKIFAAPEDPIPVRFFTNLVVAVSASTSNVTQSRISGDDDGVSGGERPDEAADVRMEEVRATLGSGGVLHGVVELALSRMKGQARLTEALLGEEVWLI